MCRERMHAPPLRAAKGDPSSILATHSQCEAVFLVTQDAHWPSVLQRLRQVDAYEAARKAAALSRLRDAFHWGAPTDEDDGAGGLQRRPSGAEFAIADACEASRRMRHGKPVRPWNAAQAMARLARCTLS